MSINCSCTLLLFLLCLSLHACNGRRDLGAFGHKKQFSNKVHEDHKKGRVAKEIWTSKQEVGDHYDNNIVVEIQAIDKYLTRHDEINKLDKRSNEEIKGKSLVLDNVESYRKAKKSQVSVSWRVPHKKRGEKQPGFNLDYSPPKTHPPSHN